MFSRVRYYLRFVFKVIKRRKVLISEIDAILKKNASQTPFKTLLGYWPDGFECNDINVLRLHSTSRIGKRNKMVVNKTKYRCSDEDSLISLGKGCWTGAGVELNILPGNQIAIKDYSNIQDNCKFIGDVTIEKYCGVAPGVFISSGRHYVVWRNPEIRIDQDYFHLNDPDLIRTHSRPVHVEEDCWLGYNCFIAPGIYVGRGAQIGANTVVNKDVMPYSVVSGVPGKQYKNQRFEFVPPQSIDAHTLDHRPYFYRGFYHKNGELEVVLEKNALVVDSRCGVVILKKGPIASLGFSGIVSYPRNCELIEIDLVFNGKSKSKSTVSVLSDGSFSAVMMAEQFSIIEVDARDAVFRLKEKYNVIQFSCHIKGTSSSQSIVSINNFEEKLL